MRVIQCLVVGLAVAVSFGAASPATAPDNILTRFYGMVFGGDHAPPKDHDELLNELLDALFAGEQSEATLSDWRRWIGQWALRSFDERGIARGTPLRQALDDAVRRAVQPGEGETGVRSGHAFWRRVASATYSHYAADTELAGDEQKRQLFIQQELAELVQQVIGPNAHP